MPKRLLVVKKNTESTTFDDTLTETFDETEKLTETDLTDTFDSSTYTTEPRTPNEQKKFLNIKNSKFVNRNRSVQDSMTTSEIQKRLNGYIRLRDYSQLEKLPLFTTWIKYIHSASNKFRTGGFLMKVEYPSYIVLVNPNLGNLTWSVQLNENIIYIPDPELVKKRRENKAKQDMIKEKLYELYQDGRLGKKPRD